MLRAWQPGRKDVCMDGSLAAGREKLSTSALWMDQA